MPQGSVLGPILFLIYVNDIDEGLTCKISKFANDTKIMSRVTTTADKLQFQSNLNIVSWSEKWQIKFNINKCKILNIGNNNQYIKYTMNGSEFSKVNHEKDLVITISNDLKPDKHCSDVVKTVNKLVAFTSRTFEYKSKKVIFSLLNTLVRPRLEHCIQFWSPYYK